MIAVAHDARLGQRSNPKEANSITHRQVWQDLADKGDVRAIAALEEPTYPAWIQYLRDWSLSLFGRSGAGMDGAAALSHTTLRHWQENTGHCATPAEIEALLLLDTVRRDPSIVKAPVTPAAQKGSAASRWPTKKPAVA